MVHIGEIIERVFKSSGMTKKSFAEKINKGRENIYDIFKRESIDTELLQIIGKALNHNFFQYFVEQQSIEPLPPNHKVNKRKTKILIELEIDEDEILRLGIKDKVLQALTK